VLFIAYTLAGMKQTRMCSPPNSATSVDYKLPQYIKHTSNADLSSYMHLRHATTGRNHTISNSDTHTDNRNVAMQVSDVRMPEGIHLRCRRNERVLTEPALILRRRLCWVRN
jgi:hypothetical protein